MLRYFNVYLNEYFFKNAVLIKRLERLSALKMSQEDIKHLEEDILLSQKILHVDTDVFVFLFIN
jgi:hypothetical protein